MGSDELSDELDEENNYTTDLAQRLVRHTQCFRVLNGFDVF